MSRASAGASAKLVSAELAFLDGRIRKLEVEKDELRKKKAELEARIEKACALIGIEPSWDGMRVDAADMVLLLRGEDSSDD